jgi:hypothetical protein
LQQVAGIVVTCASLLALGGMTWAAAPAAKKPAVKKPALKAYTDPQQVDADFKFQGEYTGQVAGPDGSQAKLGAQVRALSGGAFRTVFFPGGLPGDGWDGRTIVQKSPSTDAAVPADAKLEGDKLTIDHVYRATGDGRTLVGQTDRGMKFTLTKVVRRSPTLGAKPPAGAIVLFDGSGTEEWSQGASMTPEKLLNFGVVTRRKFQDFAIHLEFMISYVPQTQGIGQRPNSGVYLQQRYEIQILDSFGVTMGKHDCGVLYAQMVPAVNMCYPPLAWQTYDIDFRAARYDASGKKTQLARCTVKFNGVVIIDNVEILHSTPGGISESPQPGAIHLQHHGLPVFFRNIWIQEK